MTADELSHRTLKVLKQSSSELGSCRSSRVVFLEGVKLTVELDSTDSNLEISGL